MSASADTPPPTADSPRAQALPIAPAGAPLCYVVDEDSSIRHFLSLVLHGSGIDTVEFADGAALQRAMHGRTPDLIFYNIALDSADAINSLTALAACGYKGAIQLTSGRGAAVLEHVRATGAAHKLNILPGLKKPFDAEAVVKIVQERNLGVSEGDAHIDLDEALANKWIEFWYQPKIDLRKKMLVGAEAYARARHPLHGVVLPGAFMKGASDASVIKLSELALTSALNTGLVLSKLGVNIPLNVNIRPAVLDKLPIGDIVRTHRPGGAHWPGLIVDLREELIISDLAFASKLNKRLLAHNIHLAIDEFGAGHATLARFGEIPFVELKMDRKFIADCGTNKINMPLCKAVVDLAHRNRRKSVAIGIEKAADTSALVSMGCDYGQGFLLGQPMAEQRFIALLRQRSGPPASQATARS